MRWSTRRLSSSSRFPQRIAFLTDGVIGDPNLRAIIIFRTSCVSFRRPTPRLTLASSFASWAVPRQEGLWIRTTGMRKFSLAELEVYGVDTALRPQMEALLIGLCQKSLMGEILKVGDKFGNSKVPMMAVQGGLDRGTWDGILCYEIIPDGKAGINEAIRGWADSAC